jgi:spore coat protein CotF
MQNQTQNQNRYQNQIQNLNQSQYQNQNQNQNQQQNQSQYTQLGAHEVMEVHEVLNNEINAINQVQLLSSHITNSQLRTMVNNQFQFMVNEYNNLVQAVSQRTNQNVTGQQSLGQPSGGQTASTYRSQGNFRPTYGLDNPSNMSPASSVAQLSDQECAGILLGLHKASASMKIVASLECADPHIRRMILQGAVNCSELAYEVWQFMNQQGYYQVPTLKQTTTDTFVNSYTAANNMNMNSGAMSKQQYQ